MILSATHWFLALLALPHVGLSAVFLTSFLAATFLPFGSEPTLFAVIKANGDLFWPVIALATLGNTLGGLVSYGMGYGARQAFARERSTRWFAWLERFGAPTLVLAWVPGIGDALCGLAGWLHLPFWQSAVYMAIGKLLRYLAITTLLLHVPDAWWQRLGHLVS